MAAKRKVPEVKKGAAPRRVENVPADVLSATYTPAGAWAVVWLPLEAQNVTVLVLYGAVVPPEFPRLRIGVGGGVYAVQSGGAYEVALAANEHLDIDCSAPGAPGCAVVVFAGTA